MSCMSISERPEKEEGKKYAEFMFKEIIDEPVAEEKDVGLSSHKIGKAHV